MLPARTASKLCRISQLNLTFFINGLPHIVEYLLLCGTLLPLPSLSTLSPAFDLLPLPSRLFCPNW